jgi:hypothetical protein
VARPWEDLDKLDFSFNSGEAREGLEELERGCHVSAECRKTVGWLAAVSTRVSAINFNGRVFICRTRC